jgi:hypothetical protein
MALKRDVDFDTPRKEAEKYAATQYDVIYPLIKDTTVNEPWGEKFWKVEGGREKYFEQPRVKLRNELEIEYGKTFPEYFGFSSSVDEYAVSREEFIKKAGNAAGRTFALLHEGKWYAKGDMGWFGVVNNETEEEQWSRVYWDIINSLPDDTRLTVIDCHT